MSVKKFLKTKKGDKAKQGKKSFMDVLKGRSNKSAKPKKGAKSSRKKGEFGRNLFILKAFR